MQLLQTWGHVSTLTLHNNMHLLVGQVSSCICSGSPGVSVSSVIKEDGSHGVSVDAARYICMLLPLNALHGCQCRLQELAV